MYIIYYNKCITILINTLSNIKYCKYINEYINILSNKYSNQNYFFIYTKNY